MKTMLMIAVIGVLLPVLFSTTNSPDHTHWMVGASLIIRRSTWSIQSQGVSYLDPHGSLPVPSMNHTTIKLLPDLLLLTDQPMVAYKIMDWNEPMPYKPQLIKQLLCPIYLITTLAVFSALVGAMLCTTAVIIILAYFVCSNLTRKFYPSYKSYRSTKLKIYPILKQNEQGIIQ